MASPRAKLSFVIVAGLLCWVGVAGAAYAIGAALVQASHHFEGTR